MEQKIVALSKGIHRNPTMGASGELVDCVNLVARDGEMVNAPRLEEIGVTLRATQELMYVHETTTGSKNYVVYDADGGGAIVCLSVGTPLQICGGVSKPKEIVSVGNILVMTWEDDVRYAVWKDNAYVDLGNHIPELNLSFGLTEVLYNDKDEDELYTERISLPSGVRNDIPVGIGDNGLAFNKNADSYKEDKLAYVNSINAAINKLFEHVRDNDYFCNPFLVRYAYRLYDGSYTMASSPILMTPIANMNPIIGTNDDLAKLSHKTVLEARVRPVYLTVQAVKEEVEALKKWGEIIKGVSVFVSSPFYRYVDNWSVEGDAMANRSILYKNSYDKDYGIIGGEVKTFSSYKWKPRLPEKDIYGEVASCSAFYKIKDYSIGELPTERKMLEPNAGAIKNLPTNEQLTDEYQTHDIVLGSSVIVVNGRLHFGNIVRKYFKGFSPVQVFGYTKTDNSSPSVKIEIYLNKSGKIIKVESDACKINNDHIGEINAACFPIYIYYPDSDAFRVCLQYTSAGNTVRRGFDMKKHPFLHGSYAYSTDTYSDGFNGNSPSGAITDNNKELLGNRIYTSEVYNPFVFDASQVHVVGEGEVLALTSNVKALSQGQFGQFPMVAFTSKGVWAMEVDSEGKYASAKPLLRDVIVRGTKPLQTDDALVYMTERGMMRLVGSEAHNISRALEGANESAVKYMISLAEWSSLHDGDSSPLHTLMTSGAKMLWDYANGIIRFYPEGQRNSYMLSVETGEWTRSTDKMPKAVVAGYPSSLVQIDGALYRYVRNAGTGAPYRGVLLTREMAFDNPLAKKVLMDLKVMRKKEKSAVGKSARVAVWVSDDRSEWIQLKSMKAKPYKWYRFAVYTFMSDEDGLEGLACVVDERKRGLFGR